MRRTDSQFEKKLERCALGALSSVRDLLMEEPQIDAERIARFCRSESALGSATAPVLRGIGRAVAASLPDAFALARNLLFRAKPHSIYEAHFSFFGALDPENFNPIERDGIELLLVEYLFQVRSSASYAAWKAGLVLGEEWQSARSRAELSWLMRSGRFAAGRMGAINGYRFILQRQKAWRGDELRPLRLLARTDKSRSVRQHARFHIDRLTELREQRGSTSRAR